LCASAHATKTRARVERTIRTFLVLTSLGRLLWKEGRLRKRIECVRRSLVFQSGTVRKETLSSFVLAGPRAATRGNFYYALLSGDLSGLEKVWASSWTDRPVGFTQQGFSRTELHSEDAVPVTRNEVTAYTTSGLSEGCGSQEREDMKPEGQSNGRYIGECRQRNLSASRARIFKVLKHGWMRINPQFWPGNRELFGHSPYQPRKHRCFDTVRIRRDEPTFDDVKPALRRERPPVARAPEKPAGRLEAWRQVVVPWGQKPRAGSHWGTEKWWGQGPPQSPMLRDTPSQGGRGNLAS